MNATATDPAMPAAEGASPGAGDEQPAQSGTGTVSLGIGAFSLLALIACWLLSAIGGDNPNTHASLLVVLGLIIALSLVLAVVGLVLGLLGLFKKDKRKSFALFGLLLNLSVIIGGLVLIINGNTA